MSTCDECGGTRLQPSVVITGGDVCSGPLGDICEAAFHSRADALRERAFYRSEIDAVIDLELRGIRCPSTFDGGAYLRQCVEAWRVTAQEARRLR
jgi:hypothetical protein